LLSNFAKNKFVGGNAQLKADFEERWKREHIPEAEARILGVW
jgi:hypothetical protein